MQRCGYVMPLLVLADTCSPFISGSRGWRRRGRCVRHSGEAAVLGLGDNHGLQDFACLVSIVAVQHLLVDEVRGIRDLDTTVAEFERTRSAERRSFALIFDSHGFSRPSVEYGLRNAYTGPRAGSTPKRSIPGGPPYAHKHSESWPCKAD